MSCTFPRLQSETLTDPAQKNPPGPVSSVLSGSWKAPVAAAYVSIIRNVFSCSRGRSLSPQPCDVFSDFIGVVLESVVVDPHSRPQCICGNGDRCLIPERVSVKLDSVVGTIRKPAWDNFSQHRNQQSTRQTSLQRSLGRVSHLSCSLGLSLSGAIGESRSMDYVSGRGCLASPFLLCKATFLQHSSWKNMDAVSGTKLGTEKRTLPFARR